MIDKTKLNDADLDMIWLGSFRYYLGSMTINTHSYCDLLMRNWEIIPSRAKAVIKRDLCEAIKRDDLDIENQRQYKTLGNDFDSDIWREVWKVASA